MGYVLKSKTQAIRIDRKLAANAQEIEKNIRAASGQHIYKHIYMHAGEGNGTPLQYSCLENPMDRGAWWAAVHGVAKSWTWLSNFTFPFHFHALEKEMATHSSVLAWRIPWMGEPGGLPSVGSHRVGHDWSDLAAAYMHAARVHTHTSMHRREREFTLLSSIVRPRGKHLHEYSL